ncbi:MAG: flagellar basal body-associated FliL family protein [Gammaproteobacteria bacterium]
MAEATADAAPGGNKKTIILIAAGALLLVVIAGGIGAFFASSGPAATTAEGGETTAEEAAAPVESFYIDLKPEFVINFRDRHDRTKFLKAEISVATKEEDLGETVERHMPAIRNALVLLMSRQIYDDLIPHEGKERLRQEALVAVQGVLEEEIGRPGVDNLYFANFVMH